MNILKSLLVALPLSLAFGLLVLLECAGRTHVFEWGNHFFMHTTFGEIWFCVGGVLFLAMMAVWAIAIAWWVMLLAVRCWVVTVPLAVLAGVIWIAG